MLLVIEKAQQWSGVGEIPLNRKFPLLQMSAQLANLARSFWILRLSTFWFIRSRLGCISVVN